MAFVVGGGIVDCLMCSTSIFCAYRSATFLRILPWSEVMSPSAWVGVTAGGKPLKRSSWKSGLRCFPAAYAPIAHTVVV